MALGEWMLDMYRRRWEEAAVVESVANGDGTKTFSIQLSPAQQARMAREVFETGDALDVVFRRHMQRGIDVRGEGSVVIVLALGAVHD